MDLLIGDPRSLPHPIRAIGRLIGYFDKALLGDIPPEKADPESRDKKEEYRKGVALVIIVLLTVILLTAAVMAIAYRINPLAGVCVEAVLTCYILAQTSLRRESMKVYEHLKRGDIEGARKAVSMIVGRDTDVLDESGITKAAVETVAENFSDGVSAPMIYSAIGGPVLGMAYKAINTMDSMVGYKNDRYTWFGAAAAKLDDAANYIPSRISALLLIAACVIAGKDYDAAGAMRIWKRDRRKHKSPNSAQTESACAGALGVRLAGPNYYFGRLVEKPYIGDDLRPIEFEDIKRSNTLMMTASFICFAVCLAVIGGISWIK